MVPFSSTWVEDVQDAEDAGGAENAKGAEGAADAEGFVLRVFCGRSEGSRIDALRFLVLGFTMMVLIFSTAFPFASRGEFCLAIERPPVSRAH
jgi:hypothetical protein